MSPKDAYQKALKDLKRQASTLGELDADEGLDGEDIHDFVQQHIFSARSYKVSPVLSTSQLKTINEEVGLRHGTVTTRVRGTKYLDPHTLSFQRGHNPADESMTSSETLIGTNNSSMANKKGKKKKNPKPTSDADWEKITSQDNINTSDANANDTGATNATVNQGEVTNEQLQTSRDERENVLDAVRTIMGAKTTTRVKKRKPVRAVETAPTRTRFNVTGEWIVRDEDGEIDVEASKHRVDVLRNQAVTFLNCRSTKNPKRRMSSIPKVNATPRMINAIEVDTRDDESYEDIEDEEPQGRNQQSEATYLTRFGTFNSKQLNELINELLHTQEVLNRAASTPLGTPQHVNANVRV